MKKFFISILLMTIGFAFSQRLPKKLVKQLEDSGLFYFVCAQNGINAEPKIVNYASDKLPLRMSYDTNEEYLRGERPYLDSKLFSDKEKATIKDIQSVMKRGLNISELPDYSISYKKRRWVDGKKLSFEICYGQSLKPGLPVYGAGKYTFTAFAKDGVYRINLSDSTDGRERNADYDVLTEYFYFKEGIRRDMSRGIEGTRGYYFINEDAAERFYQKLTEKDSALPESALRFQEAAECIETILKNYK